MQNSNDLILTVIVITTNREHTIIKTLESIRRFCLSQTVVKLYDFKSDDESVSVVNNYLQLNKLKWSYEVIDEKYDNCTDWQHVLERQSYGWLTYLEGDDCWTADMTTSVCNIVKDFPSVGLIHYSGGNEKGLKSSALNASCFMTGSEYRNSYLIRNFSSAYPPSQTFFKKNQQTEQIEFNCERYTYAPEPKYWLDLSYTCDVYISNSIYVYRGISAKKTTKLCAAIDLITYANDLCTAYPLARRSILSQAFIFLIWNYYGFLAYRLIRGQMKFNLKNFYKPITLFFSILRSNL